MRKSILTMPCTSLVLWLDILSFADREMWGCLVWQNSAVRWCVMEGVRHLVWSCLLEQTQEQSNRKSTPGVCLGKESIVLLCNQSWQCSSMWAVPKVEETGSLNDKMQATLTVLLFCGKRNSLWGAAKYQTSTLDDLTTREPRQWREKMSLRTFHSSTVRCARGSQVCSPLSP